MQLELSSVNRWKGDTVIVEVLDSPEKIGNLYVPENHRNHKDDGGALWRGKIAAMGDKLDLTINGWDELKRGAIVWMRPFSFNCPDFKDSDGRRFVIARQEDVFCTEEVAA